MNELRVEIINRVRCLKIDCFSCRQSLVVAEVELSKEKQNKIKQKQTKPQDIGSTRE